MTMPYRLLYVMCLIAVFRGLRGQLTARENVFFQVLSSLTPTRVIGLHPQPGNEDRVLWSSGKHYTVTYRVLLGCGCPTKTTLLTNFVSSEISYHVMNFHANMHFL